MTVAETREKSKRFIGRIPRDILIITILALVSSLSFGLGYLAGIDAGTTNQLLLEDAPSTSPPNATSTEGQVVASKTGTKYYLPTCSGVDRISDANKVWFISRSAAEKAGYAPATNCTGL